MRQMERLKEIIELKARVKQRQKVAVPVGITTFIAVLYLISKHPEWGAIYEVAILPASLITSVVYFAVSVIGLKRIN